LKAFKDSQSGGSVPDGLDATEAYFASVESKPLLSPSYILTLSD
jgi:hypothetical protein